MHDHAELSKYQIEKLAIYICKMAVHDYNLAGVLPSMLAGGVVYVTMKI